MTLAHFNRNATIMAQYLDGVSVRELATQYSLSPNRIYQIRNKIYRMMSHPRYPNSRMEQAIAKVEVK